MPQIITPNGAVSTGMTSFSPSRAVAHRAANGYFYFPANVNGGTIRFVLDTGATTVMLRAEDADKAGFDVDRLNYSGHASTPNGVTRVAPVILSNVTVGGITLHNVSAIIGQPGLVFDNLLGQSFTGRLPGVKIEGDTMVLQGG